MYKEILSLISQNKNVFITGQAGTGKSHTLTRLKHDLPELVVTASTGVAAINIHGQTIHSFAGLGYGLKSAKQIASSMRLEKKYKIKDCTLLAIDEISMLSAETFNLINTVFKLIKSTDLPFGGIQLIVIGDFLQLPPVSKDNQAINFAFESTAWKEANFINKVLTKQYRQQDINFLSDLNKVRLGDITTIDNTSEITIDTNNAVHLFALNRIADAHNKTKLDSLRGAEYHFQAIDIGFTSMVEKIDKDCLVPKDLYLKIGARVMLLINKYIDLGLSNGSLGEVIDIINASEYQHAIVKVRFDNGIEVLLGYEVVAKIIDKNKTRNQELASREQIPLRLAYALTIHKAQGLTLDSVCIDCNGTFECGQIYVALSRVRSKNNLIIKNLKPNMIKANKKALAFYKELQ